MVNDYDQWQDEQHVRLIEAEHHRLNGRTVDMILRNATRPSEWPANRLPAHVSTRDGLAEAAREFLKTNRDYMFPEVSDKNTDVKY